MPGAIIVGASSGIGRELAKVLADNGYSLGLAARRLTLLCELQKELGNGALVRQMDVADPDKAVSSFNGLIEDMGRVDLVVISAGTGHLNHDLAWDLERETIDVNVSGFTAITTAAMQYFVQSGSGHLVNLSSLAALRGSREAPAYSASKAYGSNYMEGLRQKAKHMHLPVTLTDIQLGYVNTRMAQGEGLFWVASPERAARQIYEAIRAKKKRVYVTKRWRLVAWLLKCMPDILYDRL
jgi:short-subunit dehydrogenase